jgi:hypothetical protein
MAKHSVTEAMLQIERKSGPAPIVEEVFRLADGYQSQQNILLNGIANTLHCKLVVREVDQGYRKVKDFMLYGTRSHIARVRTLHASLVIQMLSGARAERPDFIGTPSDLKVWRRSWMRGFIKRVLDRLGDTEQREADQVPGVSLVLVTDGQRAEAMAHELHGKLKYTKTRAMNYRSAVARGAAAADLADIGGAKLGNSRKALSR